MLILTRKLHEKLLIGENIEIQVVGVKGHQIRLGIIAPAKVQILREELCMCIFLLMWNRDSAMCIVNKKIKENFYD